MQQSLESLQEIILQSAVYDLGVKLLNTRMGKSCCRKLQLRKETLLHDMPVDESPEQNNKTQGEDKQYDRNRTRKNG